MDVSGVSIEEAGYRRAWGSSTLACYPEDGVARFGSDFWKSLIDGSCDTIGHVENKSWAVRLERNGKRNKETALRVNKWTTMGKGEVGQSQNEVVLR